MDIPCLMIIINNLSLPSLIGKGAIGLQRELESHPAGMYLSFHWIYSSVLARPLYRKSMQNTNQFPNLFVDILYYNYYYYYITVVTGLRTHILLSAVIFLFPLGYVIKFVATVIHIFSSL